MEPEFVSPRPGSTLDGSIQIFQWDLGGIPIEQTYIYAGATFGSSNYGRRAVGADTEGSIGGLPADGSTVFVRIWYRTGGAWSLIDASYTAASESGLPAFIAPNEGARLSGQTQRFEWNSGAVPFERSWLYVGSEVGGSDYAVVATSDGLTAPGSTMAASVGGLPIGSDQTIHVRLYILVGGSWYSTDHTFKAAEIKTKDQLTRELQTLVGVTPDGDIGPLSRAAMNQNWLGRPSSFDPSFAARFVNDQDLVRWVQTRVAARGGPQVRVTGVFDTTTEAAVVAHLDRGGVVAAESFIVLLDP